MHQPGPDGPLLRGTNVQRIRHRTMQNLKVLLDPESTDGRDWRALADFLGFQNNFIKYLDSHDKRTETIIWEVYPNQYPDACVEEIILALAEIGRDDAGALLQKDFPGINLEQLRLNGPPRQNSDPGANCNGHMDTAQQHREPCFSDCDTSNGEYDTEMDYSAELDAISVPRNYQRPQVECVLTVEILNELRQNHARTVATHPMPQTLYGGGISTQKSVLQSPNQISHNGSNAMPCNYAPHNSYGEQVTPYQSVNGNHFQFCDQHPSSTSGPLSHNSAPLHYRSHSGNIYQMGNGRHSHNHMSTHEHRRINPSNGEAYMLLHNFDGQCAMDCENGTPAPLDLSMEGHHLSQRPQTVPQGQSNHTGHSQGRTQSVILSQGQSNRMILSQGDRHQMNSFQGHQLVPSQGEVLRQFNQQPHQAQFNLTSTGCSDIRVGGMPLQNGNRGAAGNPINVSRQYEQGEFQQSTPHNTSVSVDRRVPTKSLSWPGSQHNSYENICTDSQPKSGRSANSILQRWPHDEARRPTVFMTYTFDSKSTMKRVVDLGECLKKNEFKVSVDMFEADLVTNVELDANWHNIRYDKANFILVLITKKYREMIERDDQPDNITKGGTHAKHIYNRMLCEGKTPNKRIVLLLFPNTNPDDHIPPRLREIAAEIFSWPDRWKDVLYYLIWPQKIMHMPSSDTSSISSSDSFMSVPYNHKPDVSGQLVNHQQSNQMQQLQNGHLQHHSNVHPQHLANGLGKRSLEKAIAMQPTPSKKQTRIKRESLEEEIRLGNARVNSRGQSKSLIEQKKC